MNVNAARCLGIALVAVSLYGCGDATPDLSADVAVSADDVSDEGTSEDVSEIAFEETTDSLSVDDALATEVDDSPSAEEVQTSGPDAESPDPVEPEEPTSSEPSAEMATPYFDPERVLNVDIQLASEDWDALRAETRTVADILGGDCLDGPPEQMFTWFGADVSVDGVSVEGVGIRKKGYLGSMSRVKPSLKIRFDKYDDQYLDDGEGGALKWLTLNNVQQDASKLNTCMSYHVFALAGRPAPRCNFAKVSVNGEALGLYVHVESVKSAFIAHHFEEPSGNLYEGTLSDFREIWSNTFEKKTNASAADWSDIEAVKAALSDESDAGLVALGEHVDLDLFMTHWALEVMVGHWDGYTGNRNNYFIYSPPGGKFVFIPWGPDSSFTPIDNPFNEFQEPQSVMAHGGLAYRLYQNPETRLQYLERVRELFDAVWDEEALNAEVDRMAALIQAHGTPQEIAASEGEAGLGRVRDFIDGRRAAVNAEMGGALNNPDAPLQGVAWPLPLASPDICWEVLGAIDISFSSNWGTSEADNFMDIGGATIASYEVGGSAIAVTDSGVTSGPGEGHAGISIIHSLPDGSFDVIALYVPYPSFSPGTAVFDGWAPAGHRIRFGPPQWQPEYLGRVDSAELVFTQAGTTPNAPISGHLKATLYGFGGYVSGSGSSGEPTADIGLVVNEIAAKGEPLDWVEFYNLNADPIDLSGFFVADDLNDESKRVNFQEGTVIGPGEYLLVEFDKDAWPGFALGGEEEFGVWTPEGTLVDSADWSTGFSGAEGTYARLPDVFGSFMPGVTPTPGAPND